MKTLCVFILCSATSMAHCQFHKTKSTLRTYTIESIELAMYKPRYILGMNTDAQKSMAPQPVSSYVPAVTLSLSNGLGSAYSYTGKNGTTVYYTFDQFGNFSGSTVTFKEKKKRTEKHKFRH